VTWPAATRAQVLARAAQGFGSGLGRVEYSQDILVGDYRADCSGYVCRCLGLTDSLGLAGWWGGLNTETLVSSGAMYEIPMAQLRPGDLCGNCGPGSGGDAGHVVVFAGWVGQAGGQYWIYEQAGATYGPLHRTIPWPYPGEDRWAAYRYRGIQDGATPTVDPSGEDDGMGTYTDGPWSGGYMGLGATGWPVAGLLSRLVTQPEGATLKGKHQDGSSVVDADVFAALARFKARVFGQPGQNGVVGAGTWHVLCGWWEGRYLAAGAHGQDVARLQGYLRLLGHDVEMAAVMGPKTVAAVKAYNAAGVVGPGTVMMIESALRKLT
jgi:hypothetical protein